jgi:hypothetical protein
MDLPKLEQATIAFSLQRVVDLMEASHIDASPILETGQLTVVGSTELAPNEEKKKPAE